MKDNKARNKGALKALAAPKSLITRGNSYFLRLNALIRSEDPMSHWIQRRFPSIPLKRARPHNDRAEYKDGFRADDDDDDDALPLCLPNPVNPPEGFQRRGICIVAGFLSAREAIHFGPGSGSRLRGSLTYTYIRRGRLVPRRSASFRAHSGRLGNAGRIDFSLSFNPPRTVSCFAYAFIRCTAAPHREFPDSPPFHATTLCFRLHTIYRYIYAMRNSAAHFRIGRSAGSSDVRGDICICIFDWS